MTENNNGNGKSRRTFLKEVAAYSGGIALAGYATDLARRWHLQAKRRMFRPLSGRSRLGWSCSRFGT